MNRTAASIIIMCIALALAGCARRPHDARRAGTLPAIYPDYIGTTIPAGIAPLNFCIDSVDLVDVEVRGSKGGHLAANGRWACFDIDNWHRLTALNAGGRLTFSVCTLADGQWTRYDDFDISVSTDPLDDFGVVYRKIAPGYETFSHIGIYQRNISTFDEYAIVESTAAPGQCINCHAFRGTDPDHFQLHFRGLRGATLIQTEGRRRWLNTKTDRTISGCAYPYWHPTGRYCAYSLNLVHQRFFAAGEQYIEVFDKASDAVVLDVGRNQLITSPCLQTDELETYPVFAADGQSIFYCTSKRYDNHADFARIRYDLCRVPFDAATGRIGTRPDTVIHASAQGKSVTFPSPSHDGRFLLYCQADFGVFPINHREADLWLLDLRTGLTHPLDKANSPHTESYHSWSTCSRWIVFSSRRDDDLHSRLFVAHIDTCGRADKAFMLPQHNPRRLYDRSHYAYNMPEFVARKVDFDTQAAFGELFSDEREQTTMRPE